jgi:hypothetical protein
MKLQDTANLSTRTSRPQNGRRQTEKGVSFGVALLGIICVVGVIGVLALLFTAG